MAKWPYNTATWLRLRAAHLAIEPECVACRESGRLTLANTVDHVVPISDGGHPFPGHDGLRSYCAACHSAKTARGVEAGAVRTSKPRKGCNPDGTPLDSAHPWHVGTAANNAQRDHARRGAQGAASPDAHQRYSQRQQADKSLRAEENGPAGNIKTQLVANGSHLEGLDHG